MKQKSASTLGRWLLCCCCALATAIASGADKKPASKNPPPKPAAQTTKAPAQSVETLSATALKSMVIISHFGRDGAADGIGAGFVISSNGLIATSLHVIGEARPIAVQLAGGHRQEVTGIHAWDRKLDLAIIRIAAKNLPALPLGDSDFLKQGAPVVALGNPQGFVHSVVQGVVSARRDFDGVEMIQLAIPIEPGNSGGPLLDLQGRVHGILTLKSAVTANLGFAMPVNALKTLLAKPNPVPMERWLTIGALNPKEWNPLLGARWSQKAGRIQVEGFGTGFGGRALCLSRQPVPDRPYEIAVTVKLDDEAGAAGLVFGADGDQKHYGFYPTAGQLRLTRFDGPDVFTWDILQQVRTSSYRPGEWNTLKVRVEQEKFFCYVNDELIMESADDHFSGNLAGLAKFRDTVAVFKNFQIAQHTGTASIPAELAATVNRQIESLPAEVGSDSPLVQALSPHAGASQSLLRERAGKLEREAGQLRKLAAAVHEKNIETELLKALQGPEEKIDLFHAALLVAKLDNEEVDIAAYQRQLQQMAGDLKAKLPARADDQARLDALNRYLFAENGFHGSRTDYYSRANSYLNEVMDDREGLPITLSVLFLELARRIGLDHVAGVSLPGHFLVQFSPDKGSPRLIDVFEGGKIISRAEAEEMVLAYTGGPLREKHLQPATKREIVIRMLRNLLATVTANDATETALRYLDLLLALDPDSAADRLNRSLLRARAGDAPGAKQDLRWLLDHEPAGVDLDRVTELYRSLR